MAMLSGKSAVVTGSTTGIGLEIARHFAKEGCNVVINGLMQEDAGEALATDIVRDFGVKAEFSGADLSTQAGVESLMMRAKDVFGGPDIVVNNAVVRTFSPIETFPVDKWELALAVNLSAAFHTIRLALPGMRAQNWGRIINMASIHSYIGSKDRIDYGTTKTALLGMTRAVATETAGTGITSNAICPGTVLTETSEARFAAMMKQTGLPREAAEKEYTKGMQPAGRFIKASSVAAMAVFLCSEAGADITGSEMSVDLGWRTKR
jgi:3-hydroxybutyrate dehydrogenase